MNNFGFSESDIGFISSALVIFSILFTIFSTSIIEYFKQTKILFTSLVISIIAYFSLGLSNSVFVFFLMAGVLTIAGILRVECLDIIFRDNTTSKELNKEEGFLYSLSNLGWLVGPLIAGFFILKYNLNSVFFVSAIFFTISLILFSLSHIR